MRCIGSITPHWIFKQIIYKWYKISAAILCWWCAAMWKAAICWRGALCGTLCNITKIPRAIPHHSKCRCSVREVQAAKQKAQIIFCAAKVSAASGGYSEPKQGQRSQSARGFCSRSTMRVPQPDIIEHFSGADRASQPRQRCLSRQAGIVRCCPSKKRSFCFLLGQGKGGVLLYGSNVPKMASPICA